MTDTFGFILRSREKQQAAKPASSNHDCCETLSLIVVQPRYLPRAALCPKQWLLLAQSSRRRRQLSLAAPPSTMSRLFRRFTAFPSHPKRTRRCSVLSDLGFAFIRCFFCLFFVLDAALFVLPLIADSVLQPSPTLQPDQSGLSAPQFSLDAPATQLPLSLTSAPLATAGPHFGPARIRKIPPVFKPFSGRITLPGVVRLGGDQGNS